MKPLVVESFRQTMWRVPLEVRLHAAWEFWRAKVSHLRDSVPYGNGREVDEAVSESMTLSVG